MRYTSIHKMSTSQPSLYIVPTFLSEPVPDSLVPKNLAVLNMVSVFIVENLRTARRHLRAMGYTKNFDTEVTLFEWDKHKKNPIENWLKEAKKGNNNIALMSECGTPCIADPGYQVVLAAHKLRIPVVPLVGPNAILLALVGSGFSGQQFTFHGYLPITSPEKRKAIKQLEITLLKTGYTQLFMETPFRNESAIRELLLILEDTTLLSIAIDLTLPTEQIITQPVSKWKTTSIALNKRYCIYSIGQ